MRGPVFTHKLVAVDIPGNALAGVELRTEPDRVVDLAIGRLANGGPNGCAEEFSRLSLIRTNATHRSYTGS